VYDTSLLASGSDSRPTTGEARGGSRASLAVTPTESFIVHAGGGSVQVGPRRGARGRNPMRNLARIGATVAGARLVVDSRVGTAQAEKPDRTTFDDPPSAPSTVDDLCSFPVSTTSQREGFMIQGVDQSRRNLMTLAGPSHRDTRCGRPAWH
jgi:hypothetical protein